MNVHYDNAELINSFQNSGWATNLFTGTLECECITRQLP